MKLIILILIACSLHLLSSDFEYNQERLDVDFKGVTNSENAILCYGTGSMIILTSDNGENWEQVCVHHDSLDIYDMTFSGENFYGILNQEYLVIGDESGHNWKSFNTGLGMQQSIEVNDENIYILSNYSIYVFNENISLVDEITILDTNSFHELCLFGERLLAAGSNGILISIDLMNNYHQEIISFRDLGLCETCYPPRRLQVSNDILYLNEYKVILSTKDLEDWSIVARDMSMFSVRNDSVYELRAINTKHLVAAQLELTLAETDSNQIISNDWRQRNVDILKLIDFKFVNDSIVVAVGLDKLIAVSKDGGINWELKSNYKGGFSHFLNDSVFYSIKSKGRVYRTTNGGLTWLPPYFTDTLVSKFGKEDYSEFNENGIGFVFTVPSYSSKGENLLITYDYGETYSLKFIGNLNGYVGSMRCNFIKQDNGYYVIVPGKSQSWTYTLVVHLDEEFNYLKHDIIDSIYILSCQKLKDSRLIGLALDRKWPQNKGIDFRDTNLYYIMYSYNNGLTWEKSIELRMQDTTLIPLIHLIDDSYFIAGVHWFKEPEADNNTISQLYSIDTLTGSRIRIFNNDNSPYQNIVYHKGYYLMVAIGYILYHESKMSTDSSSWKRLPTKDKFYQWIWQKGDNLWIYSFDTSRKVVHYYKANLEFSTDLIEDTEIQTKVYSFPAYPNPAKDIVSTRIYWDLKNDINESDIAVYNYTGTRVADRNDLTLDFINSFSGLLSWDCSKYESGIYFLVIKHGDVTRCIPVIISK